MLNPTYKGFRYFIVDLEKAPSFYILVGLSNFLDYFLLKQHPLDFYRFRRGTDRFGLSSALYFQICLFA